MKFTKFKQFAKKKSVHLLIDLDSLEQVKEGQKTLVKDHRTVMKGNRYEVKPVAVTDTHFFVVCPVCGEIHVHGLADAVIQKGCLPCGDFCGSRTSDCAEGGSCYEIYLVIA